MKNFIGTLLCFCLFLMSNILVAQETQTATKDPASSKTCIDKKDSKNEHTTCCTDPTCCDKSKTEACSPASDKVEKSSCMKKTAINKTVSSSAPKTFNTLLWLPGRTSKKDEC